MKNALEFIIKALVENEKSVGVLEEEKDGIVNFTVKVDPEEMGKVIGKEGKVIRAIRNIMRIPGVLQSKKIYITLAE